MVSVSGTTAEPALAATAAGAPPSHATVDVARMQDHAVLRFEQATDAAARDSFDPAPPSPRLAVRLLLAHLVAERTLSRLPYRAGLGR